MTNGCKQVSLRATRENNLYFQRPTTKGWACDDGSYFPPGSNESVGRW